MNEKARIDFSTNAAQVSSEVDRLTRSNKELTKAELKAQQTNDRALAQQKKQQAEHKRTIAVLKQEELAERQLDEQRKKRIARRQAFLSSASKVGGFGGAAIGQTGEATAQGGGFLALSVGAIAGGIALRSFTASVRATIDEKKKEIETTKALRKTMKDAERQAASTLLGVATSQGAGIRQGVSIYGQQEFQRLDLMASRQNLSDAPQLITQIAGVVDSLKKEGIELNPEALIKAASVAQRLGLDPRQVVANTTAGTVRQALASPNIASALIGGATGLGADEISRRRGNALESDAILALDKIDSRLAKNDAMLREGMLSSAETIVGNLATSLGSILAPSATVQAEQFRVASEQLATLRTIQEDMSTTARAIDEFAGAASVILSGENTGLNTQANKAVQSLNTIASAP